MLAQAIRTIASSSGPPGLDTSHRTVLDEEAELPAVAAKEPHIVDPQDPHWQERLEEGGRVIARQTAIREAAAKAEEWGARAPARLSRHHRSRSPSECCGNGRPRPFSESSDRDFCRQHHEIQ